MEGKLVVVSGPSGVGKTTVVARLLERTGLARSVSATTRPPRPGEVDGRDYHFYSAERFAREREAGGFLEHARIAGHEYGTPAAAVERLVREGRVVVLAIDVQGFASLRRLGRDCLGIFLAPPGLEDLRRRLEGRGDPAAEVERRMRLAEAEMREQGKYDVVIVNRTVGQAVADVEAELHRRGYLARA